MRVRHKLLRSLALSAIISAVLVAAGSSLIIRSAVRQPFLERIRSETALLADEAARLGEESPQAFVERSARRLDVRVTLIADDGRVIADSALAAPNVERMENHIDRPEIRRAARGGTGEDSRRSDTTRVEYFYSARTVTGADPLRFVRIALPASRVRQLQARHVGTLALIVLGSSLLLTGIAYMMMRTLSRPVEKMTGAVERVAAGDLRSPIPEAGGEEIARLGQAVGRMRATLLEKLAELENERSLFSSVVSGMREGLMVIDAGNRIRLANDEVRRILDLSFDPTGHMLAEAVREPKFNDDVARALAEGREIRESVVRLSGGRSFELHVSPLGSEAEGVLVLLFDVSRLEALEGVRRQFVANVSHELRTPLTAIRAFVENLLDGGLEDREDARRFVGIIQKHSERMSALIDDLTDLSLIETGAIRLDIRSIPARDVALEVAEQLRPIADERGVELSVDVPQGLCLQADRRRLEQTLTNLIENAIKFNRPGGSVRLRGHADPRPTLVVEDGGIGVAQDDQEKIFNRFFQVDQARSRASGGTGLGLAIVKHLMRLQGGRVRLESELGSGSTFTLEFPASGNTVPPG